MSLLRSSSRFVRVVLRQLANDRSALFFFLVLPVVVMVVIGSTFGNSGGSLRIGIVGADRSALGADIAAAIGRADGVQVESFVDADAAAREIRRQSLAAAVVLPDDLDASALDGSAVITLIADAGSPSLLVSRDVVRAAVSESTSVIDAGRFVADSATIPVEDAVDGAARMEPSVADTVVSVTDVGSQGRSELSAFSLTAPQNLVLFVFINSLAGAASLVGMRREGVLRRVLAGPTTGAQVVVGLGAAWFVLALVQSVVILLVGAVAFGVDWGDPVAAAALTLCFALVGSGAGLLVGALFDDPDRVAAIGPPVGIVLGALGGCMVPLEIFPPAMATVARAVPHYWAMTAWQRLIFDGDGVRAIAGPVLVLTCFGVGFLWLAARRLTRIFAA